MNSMSSLFICLHPVVILGHTNTHFLAFPSICADILLKQMFIAVKFTNTTHTLGWFTQLGWGVGNEILNRNWEGHYSHIAKYLYGVPKVISLVRRGSWSK
jgi:hypothetical protein